MLFESRHLSITAEYGTATLWLDFPGPLPNALDLARLRELDSALQFLAANCTLRALVVRSARPDGFCTGLGPEAQASLKHPTDRAAFCWFAQQVFDRLASLDMVSIALVDGLCLGLGVELALACDYRLAVCGPDTRIGFPDGVACGGGSVRLRERLGWRGNSFLAGRDIISGREARALNLVDIACCERRSKIELRTLLDWIDSNPPKPRRPVAVSGLAAERRAFAASPPPPDATTMAVAASINPAPLLLNTIGQLGDDPSTARLAADAAVRGRTVIIGGNRSRVDAGIDQFLARGFITPLEADQARGRVRVASSAENLRRAGLVLMTSDALCNCDSSPLAVG